MFDLDLRGASGDTVRTYIGTVANELEIDAVGLWQIIPEGRREFGLSGQDLSSYVEQVVLELARRGARPVRGDAKTSGWVFADGYSSVPGELARDVVIEWERAGRDPTAEDSLWFATAGMMSS